MLLHPAAEVCARAEKASDTCIHTAAAGVCRAAAAAEGLNRNRIPRSNRPPKYPPTTSGLHLLDKYAATHSGEDACWAPGV